MFIGPFVLTDQGVTCSDAGLRDLTQSQECIEAMPYVRSFNSDAVYQWGISTSMAPNGCYIFDTGMAWFNTYHIRYGGTGSSRSDTRSICRGGS